MQNLCGVSVPTPLVGSFADHRGGEGVRGASAGEVAWILPGARLDYWRRRLTAAEYGYAR